jgi:hypothetical protein
MHLLVFMTDYRGILHYTEKEGINDQRSPDLGGHFEREFRKLFTESGNSQDSRYVHADILKIRGRKIGKTRAGMDRSEQAIIENMMIYRPLNHQPLPGLEILSAYQPQLRKPPLFSSRRGLPQMGQRGLAEGNLP